MNQNQSNQTTTPLENDDTNQIDEQELRDVTGGCALCSAAALGTAGLLSRAASKALRTGSGKDLAKLANAEVAWHKVAPRASEELKPCQDCLDSMKEVVKAAFKTTH